VAVGEAMMDVMKSLPGKYLALHLVGITVVGCVVVTVLVQNYKFTNGTAQWFFSYISKWTVASSAFNFIVDWAESLSAAAVISVVIAALMEVREIRRKRALARVYKWARDATANLSSSSREILVAKRLDDWKRRMSLIKIESGSILLDAKASGNGLESKVDKAVKTLLELEDYLNDRTESADAKASLKKTVSAFAEVIK
jgi:hypothetical protein